MQIKLFLFLYSDIADNVTSGAAKYAKLGIASQSVTASTVQLVAVLGIKSSPGSDKLKCLRASCKSGQIKTSVVLVNYNYN